MRGWRWGKVGGRGGWVVDGRVGSGGVGKLVGGGDAWGLVGW